MSAAGRRPTAVTIASLISGRWLYTTIFSGFVVIDARPSAIEQVGGFECYREAGATRRGPEQAGGLPARHNARVTSAAPSISQRVHSLNRPNMVSVGTIIWLSSELM